MDNYILLFVLAGFLAGFVDSMAGGGGLIALPALMISGMPPETAIGTLKAQSLFGTTSSSVGFYGRKIFSEIRKQYIGMAWTAVGASIGTFALLSTNPAFLENIIPIMLIVVAAVFAFVKTSTFEKYGSDKVVKFIPYLALGLVWGFYDGFFGPGTGTFWTISLMFFAGQSLLSATSKTKLMNMSSNLVSILVYSTYGVINYKVALAMGVGQLLGGYIGAKAAMRYKVKIIKPLVIVVCVAIAIKLLFF